MPLIVESNPANAELFTSVTGAASQVVPSLDELKQVLAGAQDEYAIVLGPGVDLEAAASLADMLRVTKPSTSVILIRRRVDTSVLAEALRSGMREVVEERDLTGLGSAVTRARQVWQALNGPSTSHEFGPVGKLVTVFSPKGGVGKTTLAVNLAIALSSGGKKVCLVDLDLGFGDIAITLQLLPARTIADAVHMESGMDFSVLQPMLTPHKTGVSALVAPVQPDAKDSIPAALVGKVLGILKGNFDYVVVDTSPAFDEHVLQAFDETDALLLVTTLDVPTLKNVKIAVETLDLLNFATSKRHLVLNRADDKVGLTADKVESTLAMTIESSIPTSSQVANATNAGEPIVASMPKHQVSQAVHRLAGLVAGPSAVPATPSAPSHAATAPKSRAAAPKRGLLRRNSR
ncbi:MAG TPA: AAA family ATPase [Nocardioidaceae bacterium]|nr:AAA family ATPase [Nocardioidaceae bacterium]